ncbi:anaerobic ribonucleoside-triphosphate reductase activating protein [Helicobacter sp. 11S03491-1]|nr:anaerobic ribonucleoside-triphosphate reductase activating protein [Helicobacter sp. 11S03491-1]
MLDYPDKLACIVWFTGCNLRCQYCYNTEIVEGNGNFEISEILNFLDTRVGLLDGVVFSGGEASLYAELEDFASKIKRKGFLIKLDTNGSSPKKLKRMLENKILDYVALDFKSPVYKSFKITQSHTIYENFLSSLEILQSFEIPFEVRTTVHSDLLNKDDILKMSEILWDNGYRGKYFLQDYIGEKKTFSPLKTSHNKKQNISYKEIEIIWR